MVGRKADRLRMIGDVSDPYRMWFTNEETKDSVARRKVADRAAFARGQPGRHKFDKPIAVADHAQSTVASVRDLGCEVDDPLEDNRQRQLRCQGQTRLEEHVLAVAGLSHGGPNLRL